MLRVYHSTKSNAPITLGDLDCSVVSFLVPRSSSLLSLSTDILISSCKFTTRIPFVLTSLLDASLFLLLKYPPKSPVVLVLKRIFDFVIINRTINDMITTFERSIVSTSIANMGKSNSSVKNMTHSASRTIWTNKIIFAPIIMMTTSALLNVDFVYIFICYKNECFTITPRK